MTSAFSPQPPARILVVDDEEDIRFSLRGILEDEGYRVSGAESGAAALASTQFPTDTLPNSDVPNLIAWNWDPAGDLSYPIVSLTWMLFYKDQDDAKAEALRKLVKYGIEEGQKIADSMGYIPLPENLREKVLAASRFIE